VVDTSIRNCWQIGSDKIQITGNLISDKVLDEITSWISPSEAAAGNRVTTQLHKLIIYEPGSFFLPHKDTPKGGQHIGSLMVILPSKHQGGELVISHNGAEKSFSFGKRPSRTKCSWVAFYPDVIHEVKPIKSGYRASLAYHLYPPEDFHTAPTTTGDSPIEKLIQEIAAHPHRAFEFLGYFLEFKYPKTVKPQTLKGKDRIIYQALSENFSVRLIPILIRISALGGDDDGKRVTPVDVDDPEIEFDEIDPHAASEKKKVQFPLENLFLK
jgi:hypothetical protein